MFTGRRGRGVRSFAPQIIRFEVVDWGAAPFLPIWGAASRWRSTGWTTFPEYSKISLVHPVVSEFGVPGTNEPRLPIREQPHDQRATSWRAFPHTCESRGLRRVHTRMINLEADHHLLTRPPKCRSRMKGWSWLIIRASTLCSSYADHPEWISWSSRMNRLIIQNE